MAQDEDFGHWEREAGRWDGVVGQMDRSALGPDGVPYQVWAVEGVGLVDVVDEVAERLAAGFAATPELTASYTAFVPRGNSWSTPSGLS